ncbi:MAG: glycoside hydrolase family 127 protein [Mucilaginibacter polytrichastri]|nr:glycoside hydrolase family 127 protein [Mucilaginibacter polytrichastri]
MKHKLVISTFALALASCGGGDDLRVSEVPRPETTSKNAFYTGNREPLSPLHFIKLPVGSVQPKGWVRKYLELQRDGLTGHLGEISAWLDKNNNAWFSGTGKGDHGWEEVPYWLKGYGDLAYILNDPKMIAETKAWLDKAFQSQRPDGYFGPENMGRQYADNKKESLDLWGNMIMLWCMQSYYEHSQDKRVIDLMTKYFQWEMKLPDEQFLKTYWENSRGGDNLYSVYWLYNITGEEWLLDLAKKIHKNTADWKQKDNLPNWHNVNIAQCFREPATWYMQSKDSTDLDATYNDFRLIRDMYGQVPGGMFGADENARKGYNDPRQATETCGLVEEMSSDEMLLRITGDPLWADQCENVAFNTYPAAVMPDFKGLRYLTAPNMAVSDSKNHSPGIENSGPFLMMNPFSSRCCQHNHAQGWPYYAENLWMATPDNGIAAVLYSASEVKAKVGSGTEVKLTEETNYPFEEKIRFTVNTPKEEKFPIYLRVPAWAKTVKLTVNGKKAGENSSPKGYIRIENTWKDGDKLELELPMNVSVQRWAKNKNSASVNYGPLTFSLNIKEQYKKMSSTASAIGDSKWQADVDQSKWPSYEIFPESSWAYGLVLNGDADVSREFTVEKGSWPKDDFPFTQDASPIRIKAKGKKLNNWTIDQYGLVDTLPAKPVADAKTDDIELVPMGTARLRISAFPVVSGK